MILSLFGFRKSIVRLDDQMVAAVLNSDIRTSIELASRKALSVLEQKYCQIVIRQQEISTAHEFLLHLEGAIFGTKKTKLAESTSQTELPNVALKMMEKMGWSAGSGLGAREQGIKEPIK